MNINVYRWVSWKLVYIIMCNFSCFWAFDMVGSSATLNVIHCNGYWQKQKSNPIGLLYRDPTEQSDWFHPSTSDDISKRLKLLQPLCRCRPPRQLMKKKILHKKYIDTELHLNFKATLLNCFVFCLFVGFVCFVFCFL